jgi:hypothetical protein
MLPIAPPIAVTYLLFVLFLMLVGAETPFRLRSMKNKVRATLYSGGLGFAWGLATWLAYKTFFLEQNPYWIGSLISAVGAMTGFIIVARAKLSNWQSYATIVVAMWLPMFLLYGLLFSSTWQHPVGFEGLSAALNMLIPSVLSPGWLQPLPLLSQEVLDRGVTLISYDLSAQILSVGLPMAILIALGGHARDLLTNIMSWIGEPESTSERTGFLTGFLLYALLGSAVIGSFFVFTLLQGGLYSLMALGWGIASFICALAAWRWKRWGAIGLIVSAAILAVYRVFTALAMIALYATSSAAMPPAAHGELNDLLLVNIIAAIVSVVTLIVAQYALRPVLAWHKKQAIAEQIHTEDPMATGQVQVFA